MKVLVACERHGRVRDAFLRKGHDAVSCDLYPTTVKGPHFEGDMFDLDLSIYDLIIAHPPCTYLCVSGNRHYAGTKERKEAAEFIRRIWNIPVKKLAIENPVGVINTELPWMLRPYYIQPYWFGHPETKKTGIWSRGLPELKPTNKIIPTKTSIHKMAPSIYRGMLRSITYQGIADAMADQWG